MKAIPYKQTELTLIPSDKGCWGCYFLSKEMGCYCPEYLECGHYEVFMQMSRQGLKKSDQAKEMLSEYGCHEGNCERE